MANDIDARIAWCIAWSAGVLSGCFYLEPVNRLPKVGEVSWSCVDSPPCTPDQLHPGDTVQLRVPIDDRDGDEAKATLHWRASACDAAELGGAGTCDALRLHEDTDERPTFTVPQMRDTGGPVLRVVADVDVTDERGGLSSGTRCLPVAPYTSEAVCERAQPAVVRRGPP
jgi:hypothetical protein